MKAVLLDVAGIQKYIFGSNKLIENLGASHNVKEIYAGHLKEALKETLGNDIDLDLWTNKPSEVSILNGADFEVGYIGGGNALLFFKEESKAKEFIRDWTRRLLIEAPGLNTAVAIGDIDFSNGKFKDSLQKLFKDLANNKNSFFPNTVVAKYGLTADCPESGFSAEIKDDGQFISSVSYAKRHACENSQKELKEKYKSEISAYEFTADIGKLGQVSGESHIAIVHIDGNSMGERFRGCNSLEELRKLSKSVKDKTEQAFKELIRYTVTKMPYFEDEKNGFRVKHNDETFLPIRPIIIGGDDITFVCDGRLGVHFAEKFIEYFNKGEVSDGKPIYACAGIAIMKTKYPFYRGYKLAEELCSAAKKESRNDNGSSWIDFYISYGGFSGNLENIRDKHYKVAGGNLHFGPYKLADGHEKSIGCLKKGVSAFTKDRQHSTKDWPRSKVKKFRSILTLGTDATKQFIDEMRARGLELPSEEYSQTGWSLSGTTPYFDMIELMEMYPEEFLKQEGNKNE